jgi:dihydrofolate synthase/folylpolyglutamate synthase
MRTPPTTQACLEEMFALRRFGIKLGLETVRRILRHLDHPQRRFRSLHVAGTNGKGSVASLLAAILQAAGYRVGLYTSPHLVRFNERIRVNGREIDDRRIVALYRRVRRAAAGGREPTFFEFTTAMALAEFARRKVDWAVIETGMGGRLDATNAILPEAAVITNISLEHRDYLGGTLAQIASEKAGIIKRGRPVVTGVRQPAALAAITAAAARQSAPLYRRGDSFRVRGRPDGTFTYIGIAHTWRGLATALPGDYQRDNAALALAVCELLRDQAPRLDLAAVREGLRRHRWPGRLEVVARRPLVIFDGAHNLDAAGKLGRWLAQNRGGRPLTLVTGILDDKPYRAMLRRLLPHAARVIVTRARIDRALPPETLAAAARPLVSEVRIIPQVAEALRYAVATAPPEGLVLVAGSLYVVGEAREAVEQGRIRLARSA